MPARIPAYLPSRPFLYTLDQIALILNISMHALRASYIYYVGVSSGPQGTKMRARDISPDPEKREWRVAEADLVGFLQAKGFRVVRDVVK